MKSLTKSILASDFRTVICLMILLDHQMTTLSLYCCHSVRRDLVVSFSVHTRNIFFNARMVIFMTYCTWENIQLGEKNNTEWPRKVVKLSEWLERETRWHSIATNLQKWHRLTHPTWQVGNSYHKVFLIEAIFLYLWYYTKYSISKKMLKYMSKSHNFWNYNI